jgi:hypothetical protein
MILKLGDDMITAAGGAAAMGQARRRMRKVMEALAGCFARAEPRRTARGYLIGLIAAARP